MMNRLTLHLQAQFRVKDRKIKSVLLSHLSPLHKYTFLNIPTIHYNTDTLSFAKKHTETLANFIEKARSHLTLLSRIRT